MVTVSEFLKLMEMVTVDSEERQGILTIHISLEGGCGVVGGAEVTRLIVSAGGGMMICAKPMVRVDEIF